MGVMTQAEQRHDRGSSPVGSIPFRAVVWALLAWLSVFPLTNNVSQIGWNPGFLHNIHLVFHEAGHVFFLWAPPILHALGGTIGQLLMPLAIGIAFLVKNRNGFDALAFLWLFGHSLVDCAPYINDARALVLPLITGGTGAEFEGHDWEFILGRLGCIQYDLVIARHVLTAGRVVTVLSLAGMAAILVHAVYRVRKAGGIRRGD